MKDKLFWQHPENCRLMTVEIIYHMPDHPNLLQTFIWQEYDYIPEFPILNKFLNFWETNLDGKLHSVKIASAELLEKAALSHVQAFVEIY